MPGGRVGLQITRPKVLETSTKWALSRSLQVGLYTTTPLHLCRAEKNLSETHIFSAIGGPITPFRTVVGAHLVCFHIFDAPLKINMEAPKMKVWFR